MAERRTSDAERPDGGRGGGNLPERPTQLPGRSWWAAIKRTVREFRVDNLSDWAAALTYYSVLSIFPALLDNLGQVAPGSVNQILATAIDNLQQTRGLAGVLALVSLATALWAVAVQHRHPAWRELPRIPDPARPAHRHRDAGRRRLDLAYRFFASARWSADQLGLVLLDLIASCTLVRRTVTG